MRIYFAGAHATGKSTLSRYIAKQHNLQFLNEIARTVLAEREIPLETLRIDLDTVDNYQSEIFKRQIEEEKKYTSFVSDRTFDNLAYMAQHARKIKDIVDSSEFKLYVDSLKKNDAVVFFVRPARETMKNDGVRETVCWEQIIAIDAMIKLLFELFEIDYIQICTGSMQERVKLVNSVIKHKLSDHINKHAF